MLFSLCFLLFPDLNSSPRVWTAPPSTRTVTNSDHIQKRQAEQLIPSIKVALKKTYWLFKKKIHLSTHIYMTAY